MDKVVYFSQGGNTKRLADAIAKGAGVTPISVDQASELNNTDILFVGASIYKGKIDGKVREFLMRIRPSQVKVVVLFGTSAGKKTALAEVRSILKGQNIPVHDKIFHCSGSFLFFNRGRPDSQDLKQAEDFAREICRNLNER